MKAIAVLLVGITAFGTLVATALALFVATFCDENCTPDDRHPVAFVLPGLVAFVCACLVLVSIALDRGHLALGAYIAQVIAAFVLLAQALDESEHSDGKLLFFALVVELPAAAALAIAFGRRRLPRYQ